MSDTLVIRVQDTTAGAVQTSFTIPVINNVAINTTTLPNAHQGVFYASGPVSISGGLPPYTGIVINNTGPNIWNMAANLTIIGTPTTIGTETLTLLAYDSVLAPASAQVILQTLANFLVIQTASPLPDATQSVAYSATITATGGVLPYTWAIVGHTGTNSWSMAPTTGIITGTPATVEGDTITVRVTDSDTPPTQVAKIFSVTVDAASTLGGGSNQVINFPNFSSIAGLNLISTAAQSGTVINLTDGTSHHGGCVWSSIQRNIQAFTTHFTFNIAPLSGGINGYGFCFVIQNSNNSTNPVGGGGNFGANQVPCSANGLGYGAGGGSGQPSTANSIGVVFSVSPFNESSWFVRPAPFSSVGLYVDGGPAIGGGAPFGLVNGAGFASAIDVHPFGLNFASGNPIDAVVSYDGTILTLVTTDTVSLATTRHSWPVNIPAIVGANTAWVGFMSNQPDGPIPGRNAVRSWTYSDNVTRFTRLAPPTFSVPAGQYTGTQSVTMTGTGNMYYTTNGTPPTTASTQYVGTPIIVSASTVLRAVAVLAGFTDSFEAQALYRIQATATPTINFPSGFASANGLIQPVGNARITGSNLVLSDNSNTFESGAGWFGVPVSVASFSTSFTVNPANVGTSFANGFGFVLQNYPQTNTGTNFNWGLGNGPFGVTVVSGGPWTLSSPASGTSDSHAFGYVNIFASIGVIFDLSSNSVGLYQNGVFPGGSQVAITGGVNLATATAINITLDYNNVVAPSNSLKLTMTQGANTFSLVLSASINIAAIVNALTAFAGFVANNGFAISNINVSKWTGF